MSVGHDRCVQMFCFWATRKVGNEGTKFKVRRGMGWGGAEEGRKCGSITKPLHTPIMAHASGRFLILVVGFRTCSGRFPICLLSNS